MGAGGTHPHGHDADEIHATGAEALLHQRNAAHPRAARPALSGNIHIRCGDCCAGRKAGELRLRGVYYRRSIVRNTRTRHSHANIISKRRAAYSSECPAVLVRPPPGRIYGV